MTFPNMSETRTCTVGSGQWAGDSHAHPEKGWRQGPGAIRNWQLATGKWQLEIGV